MRVSRSTRLSAANRTYSVSLPTSRTVSHYCVLWKNLPDSVVPNLRLTGFQTLSKLTCSYLFFLLTPSLLPAPQGTRIMNVSISLRDKTLKADFHSVEFSDWTGNPLFMCENTALNLNRMPRVTNILLSQIQSARKILLNRSQP